MANSLLLATLTSLPDLPLLIICTIFKMMLITLDPYL